MNDSNRPGNTDPSFDSSKEPEFQSNQPEALSARAHDAPELSANKSAAADPSSVPGWERATLEKLAFAALNEQKATRRWKTFVRLSWLLFFVALLWMALHRGGPAATADIPRLEPVHRLALP